MPADRLFHPRLGHSEKVSGLTDLEFRVWAQYQLSADDFGVMRADAVKLQADNDALLARPSRVIQRALERIIAVGLLHTFEHQGRRFVCQHDWQYWQGVEYPRETQNPKPTADALAVCQPTTQELFGLYPGGKEGQDLKKRGKQLPMVPQPVADDLPNSSQTDPDYARARARETANGLRLTANGSGSTAPAPATNVTFANTPAGLRRLDRSHADCAAHSERLCVPNSWHRGKAQQLGASGDAELRAWYPGMLAALTEADLSEGNRLKLLDRKFTEWRKPKAHRGDLAELERLVAEDDRREAELKARAGL